MYSEKTYLQDAPKISITCDCGVAIQGNSENGVVALMKRHMESGKFHAAYLLVNNFNPDNPRTKLESIIDNASSMKKAEKVGI